MKNISKLSVLAFGVSAGLYATSAAADQQILDDLIVDGSACIGQDCANGESFGFDTIRLKENNLRIKAMDTSNSASFPSRDWQITFNETSNGGANKFSIDDIDGGRTPFTIEAAAPSHSLYVDDGGRLGLGTATPVSDIHLKTGNTPTLRLEQDGTSGFTPQIFDVASNEANFFVRDASNGSTLPLRIFPGAPTSALAIEASGDIGFGTTSPTDDLHVVRSTGSVGMRLQTGDSPLIFRMALNSNLDKFVLNFDDAVGPDFSLDSAGNVEILGTLTTAGSCSVGCDRVFAADYDLPSISDHSAKMFANGYLPNVGPTAEDGPFNVTDKLGRMLNELEHAHIYIDQLNSDLASSKADMASLQARLDKLEAAISAKN